MPSTKVWDESPITGVGGVQVLKVTLLNYMTKSRECFLTANNYNLIMII